jgi:hypothetical protein
MRLAAERRAIGAALHQAILELAARVKLARQNPANDEKEDDDAKRDQRAAAAWVLGVTIRHFCGFAVLRSVRRRTGFITRQSQKKRWPRRVFRGRCSHGRERVRQLFETVVISALQECANPPRDQRSRLLRRSSHVGLLKYRFAQTPLRSYGGQRSREVTAVTHGRFRATRLPNSIIRWTGASS